MTDQIYNYSSLVSKCIDSYARNQLSDFYVFCCGNPGQHILKKVSVITVNFNQQLLTEEFLSSFYTVNSYQNTEVIVVDNGSKIDHGASLKEKFPGVLYIRSEENLGFAGGNNLGIFKATGDYYFLVNNDTEWTGDLIDKLVTILNIQPGAGMVSPKIRYFDNREIIQYAGFTPMNFYTGRNRCIGQYEKDEGQYDTKAGLTSYAHGAAMMARKEAVEKAGLMSENFFLYYEEMDWCERIKSCGYTIWIEPKAIIYHKESVSVGSNSRLKEYFMTRNRILFIRRNAKLPSVIVFYFYFLLVLIPKNIIRYTVQNRTELVRPFFKGFCWNLINSSGRRAKSPKLMLKAD